MEQVELTRKSEKLTPAVLDVLRRRARALVHTSRT